MAGKRIGMLGCARRWAWSALPLIMTLTAAQARAAGQVRLLSRTIESSSTIDYARVGDASLFDTDHDHYENGLGGPGKPLVTSGVQLDHLTGPGMLCQATSVQDSLGFSLLDVHASDEPGTSSELCTTFTTYKLVVVNEGPTPAPLQMAFRISPVTLHLDDQTSNGLGLYPNPFNAYYQQAQITFQIATKRNNILNNSEQWDWSRLLTGGAAAAEILPGDFDPMHVGLPAETTSPVTPGQSIDVEYDVFHGLMQFADLQPGDLFELDYFITAQVGLQGRDDTGPSGGYVTGGDPFDLSGGNPAADFVFTAGDFSSAIPVPEPASAGILGVVLGVGVMRRSMRSGHERDN